MIAIGKRMGGLVRCFELVFVLCGCVARGEGGPPTPTVRGGEKVYAPTGPGQQLEPVVDPEFHMANARRDFEAGLGGSAAREIEKLEAFLGYEAERASGERRRAIEDSREELDDLAERVAHREVNNVSELDRAFAHARAALAR
jgi:hypothetical protein